MVNISWYNPFLVYCRELALGTVRLTGDRAQGDDSKHDSHYSTIAFRIPGIEGSLSRFFELRTLH